jgi:nucleotide-binding universal stress UspA family protein
MEDHKIIVAYDFHELSNAALKQSYELARFVNSGILLVLVMSDDLLSLSSDVFQSEHSENMKKRITDVMKKEIAEQLRKVADKASEESGVPVGFRIETGKIYECILSVAKEIHPRFIVMGRTSKQSATTHFGSNAMRVVETSSCPVITISNLQPSTGFRHVVLPIDLTKQTREEVFNAISFGLFFDATIHLVSVIMGGISERKSRIYKKMQAMKKTIEENGVRCSDKLFKRSRLATHEIILEYAKDIRADSIMIMTHQEISTSDKYIGAVAHQIITDSPIPVISLTSAASLDKRNEKSTYWFNRLFTSHDE